MTQNEIIEMARQAGIGWGEGIGGMTDFLEAFAKLVAEQKREKILGVLRRKSNQQIYKVLDEIRNMK